METVKAQTEPMTMTTFKIKIVNGDRSGDVICANCGYVLQESDLVKNTCSCCLHEHKFTRPMTTDTYKKHYVD